MFSFRSPIQGNNQKIDCPRLLKKAGSISEIRRKVKEIIAYNNVEALYATALVYNLNAVVEKGRKIFVADLYKLKIIRDYELLGSKS